MWLQRWRAAAATTKAARLQQQKEDEALAAADATLGRARKRRSLGPAAAAAAVTELELLQLQEQQRGSPVPGRPSSQSALADLTPAPVEQLIARQLAAAPAEQQPACQAAPEQIYLPGMTGGSSSSSTSFVISSGLGGSSSSSMVKAAAHLCPPAGLVYKLLLLSGYRETADNMRPPLYQRRVANWLRHKFTPYRPPQRLAAGGQAAAAAAAAGVAADRQQQPVLVPLGGQQHAESGEGAAMSTAAADAAGGRQVWQLGPHAELLLSKSLPLPGNEQQQLLVEVVDLIGSNMAAAAAAGSSSSDVPVPVCAGAAGVLLLISGPEPHELAAAVTSLAAVLQCTAPAAAVQVPLIVLAASDQALQAEIEASLKSTMDTLLTPAVYSRLSGGKVFCLGGGSSGRSSAGGPVAVLRDALLYAAQQAPQLPSMRHVGAAGHLLDCLTALSMPQAAAGVAEGDMLAAFVAAHNLALRSMQQGLQEQLQSAAVRWGYPPAPSTDERGWRQPQRQLQLVLSQLAALQLPLPSQLVTQPTAATAAAAGGADGSAALLHLRQYVGSLMHGAAAEAAGGVMALLLETRLPKPAGTRGGGSWNQREQQQQHGAAVTQLVLAACERLLEQLQMQLPLGRLTVAEDALRWLRDQYWEQQQQQQREQHTALDWWQQQQGSGEEEAFRLTGAAAGTAHEMQGIPSHSQAAAVAAEQGAPLISSPCTPSAQHISGVPKYTDAWNGSISPQAAAVGAVHAVTGMSHQQPGQTDSTQLRIQAELAAADQLLTSAPGSWLKAVLAGRP